MGKELPGENIEVILAEYDSLELGEVYDIAYKQEQRGNNGLALKIYEYAIARFGVTADDTPYERLMGSEIYTAIGRLYFMKEEYDRAEVSLCKAAGLDAGNFETWYWTGEVCYAKGFIRNAQTIFALVVEKSMDKLLIEKAQKRLDQLAKERISFN